MEMKILGETGNMYFTSQGRSSAEESNGFFDLSWSQAKKKFFFAFAYIGENFGH